MLAQAFLAYSSGTEKERLPWYLSRILSINWQAFFMNDVLSS